MKLCIKISAVVLVAALIPLIVLFSFVKVKWNENNYAHARELNGSTVRTEAELLNRKFSGILSAVKWYSENTAVTEYTQKARENPLPSDVAEYKAVKNAVGLFTEFVPVYAIEIKNENDTVIFSTDKTHEGQPSDFPADDEAAVNGVYPFEVLNGEPLIRFEKKIYSPADNNEIGRISFIYSIDLLTGVLEQVSSESCLKCITADSGNNTIENPYKTVRRVGWNLEYQKFSEAFLQHRNSGEKERPFGNLDYSYDRKDKSVYAEYIPAAGWYLIGIANLSEYNSENRISMFFIWIIVGISAIAVIVLVHIFMSPLKAINDNLYARSKGDTAPPLEIRSKDEFVNTAYLFTTLFDDLSARELRYRTIAEMSDHIVFDVDLTKNKVITTNNFDKKFSFRPKDNSLAESFLYKIYIHKDDKTKFASDLSKILTSDSDWRGEYRLKNRYGDFCWIRIQARKLRNKNDLPTRIVGIMTDIDREKESELHLIRKATFDALTQLNNRETFLRKLADETTQVIGKGSLLAVMFIDLDDFKHFNDNYGHKCGDEVLKYTADSIKELCFGRGFGGRFGGDEFVMCLKDLKLIGEAGSAAEELIMMLNKGFDSMSTEVHLCIGCSIGIAFFGDNGRTADEIIAAADAAMYKIKKHGKSNYAYASADEVIPDAEQKRTSAIDSDNPSESADEDAEKTETADTGDTDEVKTEIEK